MSNSTIGARDAFAVGASTWTSTGDIARGVFVGTAGAMTVTMEDGTSVTFTSLAAGVIHPLRITAITANSASDVVVLF